MKTNTLIFFLVITFGIVTFCGQTLIGETELNHKKTEVEISSLSKSPNSSDEFTLTFTAKNDTSLKVRMLIGKTEATTLAITLEQLTPKAPLPLDLFEDALKKFGISVDEIVVDSLIGNIYTAKINCSDKGRVVTIKARPADAATVAEKFKSPIFVNSNLLSRN